MSVQASSHPPGESAEALSVTRDLAQAPCDDRNLQKQRYFLSTIVEFSSDAIASVDLDGTVTSWNKAAEKMFGYSAREIVGKPVARLFPPDRLNEEQELLRRLKQGEVIAHYETKRLRKDGNEILVSVTASPIRDDAYTIIGVSKILRDITEEKRVQDELRTLQAEMVHMSRWNMMGTMASSLAHELNQPLTATMNYVQASRNTLDETGNSRAANLLDKALGEINLAAGIIRSLRAFIEKRETQRAPENINKVLDDGLALSLTIAAEAKAGIVKKLTPDLPPVAIDKVQIQQVLLNLVRNATEAMRDFPDGRIVIETGLGEPGFVRVSVGDSGPGLSPEILRQPFQAFVTTKKHGMGVGLSICRTIVETHGGRIWAEPNLPRGVTFHFQLPIANQ